MRKKVDRGRLPHGRGDGAAGLVHRPGRAVPDDPLSGPVVAARGRAGAATARVPPRRHGQGPDAVPPGRRSRPCQGRDGLPERRPASLAQGELAEILAAMPGPSAEPTTGWRPAWERWQEGLAIKPTLPDKPPPLRMLLVLDNLAGHKTPAFVCWLFDHGIMPLYTPVGGSWLNMAESLQRDPEAKGVGRPVPDRHGPDHRLVRGGGAALGRGPDAVRLGREAGRPSASATRASPPARRLGGLRPRPPRPGSRAGLWPRPSQMTHERGCGGARWPHCADDPFVRPPSSRNPG